MNVFDSLIDAMAVHPLLIISALAASVLLTAVAAIICCEPWAGEDDDVMQQAIGDAPHVER